MADAGARGARRARAARRAFPTCTTWAADSWPICRPGACPGEPRVATRSPRARRRALQRRQAAGRTAGRHASSGAAGAGRRCREQSARAGHAGRQADARGPRGHAGAVRGSPTRAMREIPVLRMLTARRRPCSRGARGRLAAECPAELRPKSAPASRRSAAEPFRAAPADHARGARRRPARGRRPGAPAAAGRPVHRRAGVAGRVLLDPRTLPEDAALATRPGAGPGPLA